MTTTPQMVLHEVQIRFFGTFVILFSNVLERLRIYMHAPNRIKPSKIPRIYENILPVIQERTLLAFSRLQKCIGDHVPTELLCRRG